MAKKKRIVEKDINLKLYEDSFLNNHGLKINYINELGKSRKLNDTLIRYIDEGIERDIGLNSNNEKNTTNDINIESFNILKEIINNQNEEIVELKEMILLVNNKRKEENDDMNKRLDLIVGMLEKGNTVASDVVKEEEEKPQKTRNRNAYQNLIT